MENGRDELTWPRRKMKLIGLIFLGTLGGMALASHGQDAAPPSVDLYSGQKQPDVTPTAIPSLGPIAPELPELSQLDQAFKQRSLGKEVDQRRLHVEWRQLKNRVVNDPAVRTARAAAEAARTDLEKRQRIRDYYNIYYERMSALASSLEMKLALEVLKMQHVNVINQPRVRPSPSASPGQEALKLARLGGLNSLLGESLPSDSPQPETGGDLLSAAKSTGQLNMFATALNIAGGAAMLKDKGPYTVFAPSDEAFTKLPAALKPGEREKLVKLLTYHVIKGALTTAELATSNPPTVNGATLNIKVTNGEVMVNDAHVIKADVKASNGVIHVIDKVLIPPGQ